MFRCGSGNPFRWLWLAAMLIAMSFGGASPSAATGVCSEKALEPCAERSPHGWSTALVEVRQRKAQAEAIAFADRVKRHLGRQFGRRKVQFVKTQARLEKQRVVHKRHAKAQAFATARRHAAESMHKLQPLAKGHLRRFVHNAPRSQKLAAGNARAPALRRTLWRHDARNESQPQQQAN
jgi:hypothetical protein